MEKIKKFFQSNLFRLAIGCLVGIVIILLVFKAGTIVGFKKAGFSFKWADNYHRNFAGPKKGFAGGFGDREFMNANGVFGQIIKIDGTVLTVKGQNDVEKIILADDKTVIKNLQETLKLADLKVGDFVVVIGDANDAGQIAAKLIRIMPPHLQPVKNRNNQ